MNHRETATTTTAITTTTKNSFFDVGNNGPRKDVNGGDLLTYINLCIYNYTYKIFIFL